MLIVDGRLDRRLMRLCLGLGASLGLMLVATPSPAAEPSPLAQRLQAVAQSYADRGLFAGAVLVARGDEILLDRGYGLASQEWQQSNAPDVRYLLASVSKQFTAAAVLRLVDQGRLGLDDPLHRHLPDTPLAWRSITVRQLMAHTSGIPNHTEGDAFERIKRQRMSPREIVATFRDLPLDFAPGSAMRYSNSGYILLGVLIETLTGQRYAEHLATAIFQPLKMADTGVAHGGVITPRLASGYVKTGPNFRPAEFLHLSVPYAAGALFGTTGDLLKWQRGLYGGAVLSPGMLQAMTTPVLAGYGLGLGIDVAPDGRRAYRHAGGINGFATFLQYEPGTQLTIAVLGNFETASSQMLAGKLSAAANGVAVRLPQERRPVAMDAAQLARYEGAYERTAETTLWVRRRGDELWARMGRSGWARILPESPTDFYVPEADAELLFALGPDGRVLSATPVELTAAAPWPRVERVLATLSTQPLYLRGSMNQWSTGQPLALGADGLHRTTLELAAGAHEFKLASEDWAVIDLGQRDQAAPLAERGSLSLVGVGGNIALEIRQRARCEFVVDGRDLIAPQLTVDCRAP
ncbi:MAG TPA: serine hydrolase [Rubrivivax sp.]|nr:serine hydrolase [Rubrivivax sp.]